MTEQELINLLTDNIQFQLRHANYTRAVEIRNFSRMIATGEGQDEEVTRYRRFEDETLKKQRKRLYNPLTKYALARPRKYWKKMFRVEGIRRRIEAPDETAVKELENMFYNFMPGESLEQWQNRVVEYLGVVDPNAWILYERNDERGADGLISKTSVYPVIISSVDALNYEKKYGALQWLLFRTITIEHTVKSGYRQDRLLENYYLYAPGMIVRAREVGEKTIQEPGEVSMDIPVYSAPDAEATTSPFYEKVPSATGAARNAKPPTATQPANRTFYISTIQNGTTEVPAECVGAYMDEVSGSDVFVAWFDPAEDVFRDLIRDKSVSDVLKIVYAYPKTWEFTQRCRHVSVDMGVCDGGYYSGIIDEHHRCQSCNGTGISANFTTEQETLQIPLPEDPRAMLELAKLSFTQPVDISLLQHVDASVETAEKRIMAAVFDSGLYQKPTNSQTRTATEVNAEMDGISDVLHPFGALLSRHFELAYRVAAQYREIQNFTVDHSFPDDLKIETLAYMVAAFDDIKKSGVGYEAIAAQRKRIFQKQFEGSPDVQKRIEARYRFLPFDDKTPEDVSFVLSALSPTDNTRVLWTYWLQIFDEIEEQYAAFPDMEYGRQREIVDAKVQEFKQKMTLAGDVVPVSATEPPSFNQVIPGVAGAQ